ncbi:MAG: histidine kinase [Bacteroidales bacterium]|nr:histidine kinase [Bacteroidales bacterium]
MSRKLPRWAIHLLVWLLICGFNVFVGSLVASEVMAWAYIGIPPVICSCALFYLNYCFLIGKYWAKRRFAVFVLLNMAALLLAMLFQYESYIYMFNRFGTLVELPDTFDVKILAGFMAFAYIPSGLFFILISSLIKTSWFWNQSQTRLQELENERIKAELDGLKSQINPHFLFNSLNAIYALIDMDSDKAQEATHALSNLLRYVLNEKNEEMVPLAEELKFTRDYIDLMSLRFSSDMLSLKVEMPDETEGWMIAPMLMMTLIENAFKHGISNTAPSFILILIHISDGRLYATVSNSLFPKKENDPRSGGIGLDNLSRRLELIYGNDASMNVTQEDGAYTTKLEIPLRK